MLEKNYINPLFGKKEKVNLEITYSLNERDKKRDSTDRKIKDYE